ncbi:hypothetical protein AGR9A_Lc40371 [Agrobacterium salinitolerans str. Hayward 0363]|nr:hypothetical protein AGR9A_Lc40371 [Agrobacterium salinitolerans str. Hayward 0363]
MFLLLAPKGLVALHIRLNRAPVARFARHSWLTGRRRGTKRPTQLRRVAQPLHRRQKRSIRANPSS